MPHPSEPKINIRLQTRSRPATEVFREGLTQLIQVAEHIGATFQAALPEQGAEAGSAASAAGGVAAGTDGNGDAAMAAGAGGGGTSSVAAAGKKEKKARH
jgi:hypothetical protein